METITITPKNKSEYSFILELLSKLNITFSRNNIQPKEINKETIEAINQVEYVSDKEQKEIEEELKDPDCKIIAKKVTVEL